MISLLKQLKTRRIALGLKQHDMMLRIGVSRQQYQRLESKGNPRLDTLELIAKGLNSALMLIPEEKLHIVKTFLENDTALPVTHKDKDLKEGDENSLAGDPWKDVWEEDE